MISKIGKLTIDTTRGEVLVGTKRYLYTFVNKSDKNISIIEGERGNDPAHFWRNPRKTWDIPCLWTLKESKMHNEMHVVHWKDISLLTITFGDGNPYLLGAVLRKDRKFVTFGNMPDVDI